MDKYVYRLRAANGIWPKQIGPTILDRRVTGSTRDKAIRKSLEILRDYSHKVTFDHAWLVDDDGWTVWPPAEDNMNV